MPPGDAAATGAPGLPIHFQNAAPPFHGFYDAPSGQVFINTDLSGAPLTITIAHEIGHAFGLVHIPADQRSSVMNPNNLVVEPTAEDVDTLANRWGGCLASDAPYCPGPASVVSLFTYSPATAVADRRRPARAAVVEPNGITGPRAAPRDQLPDRDLPGRHRVRGRPLRGPPAELLRRERRGDQRDRRRLDRPGRVPAAVRLRGDARAQRVAGRGGLAWYNVPAASPSTTAPDRVYQIGPFPMRSAR